MNNQRGRGDWRRQRRRRPRSGFAGRDLPQCPYCQQSVRDVLTAIAAPDSGAPAHFDCVIRKLAEDEDLRPKEKICYLGNGSFGIVKFRSGGDPNAFTVIKRIQYEVKDQEIAWRKSAARRVPL